MNQQEQKPAIILPYANGAGTGLQKRTVFLIIVLVLLGAAGAVAFRLVTQGLNSTGVSTQVAVYVASVKSEAKYVVATQNLSVQLKRTETYDTLWKWLYLGTSEAEIRVDECKVQYIIPTDKISRDDFQYDAVRKVLTVTLPRPVLDTAFVDVPSDPSKWWVRSSNAWARFNRADVEVRARQELRREVLTAGRLKGFDEATEAVATQRLKKVIEGVLGVPGMKVEVIFQAGR